MFQSAKIKEIFGKCSAVAFSGYFDYFCLNFSVEIPKGYTPAMELVFRKKIAREQKEAKILEKMALANKLSPRRTRSGNGSLLPGLERRKRNNSKYSLEEFKINL